MAKNIVFFLWGLCPVLSYADTRVLREEHKGTVTIAELQREIARVRAAGARCGLQALAGQSLCSGG